MVPIRLPRENGCFGTSSYPLISVLLLLFVSENRLNKVTSSTKERKWRHGLICEEEDTLERSERNRTSWVRL